MNTTNKTEYTKKSELIEFSVNGIAMSTTLSHKFRNRTKWTKKDERKITSFIPGTVREVFVKEGDTVKENDRLLILEAMKMLNVIVAPIKGKISKISVKPGDTVTKSMVMVELE